MLALSALSSIANVARTRVRPRAPGGARHGADDCGAQKTSESKRSRGPRENSKVTKNTHRVCRRSLEKPKTQHEFIFAQKRLARLRRGSSSALRSDGLVGYDVSFTRRRSGVRTPVGVFLFFGDCCAVEYHRVFENQTRWRFPRCRRRALRTTTPATRRRA